jgi:hypothetical protein
LNQTERAEEKWNAARGNQESMLKMDDGKKCQKKSVSREKSRTSPKRRSEPLGLFNAWRKEGESEREHTFAIETGAMCFCLGKRGGGNSKREELV